MIQRIKYLLLVVGIIIIVILIAYPSIIQLSLFEGDSTDEDTDSVVNTKHWYHACDTARYKSLGWLPPSSELVHEDRIALSWSSDGDSESITVDQVGFKPGRKWGCSITARCTDNPHFSGYWYQVEVWDGSHWNVLIDRAGIASTDVESQTSVPWNIREWNDALLGDGWWLYSSTDLMDYYCSGYPNLCYEIRSHNNIIEDYENEQRLTTIPNTFRIKGNDYAGTFARVAVCSYFLTLDGCPLVGDFNEHCTIEQWVVDDVILADGTGDIVIDPGPHGGGVYEEDDTVLFSVKTGYAGSSTSTVPWKVVIHEPSGAIAVGRNIVIKDLAGNTYLSTGGSGIAEFELQNDLWYRGFTWYVEPGTVQDEDYSYGCRWTFELVNTVTTEKVQWAYYVREGEAECGPVDISGTMGAFVGDSIDVTVSAKGNTDPACTSFGSGDVDYFIVNKFKDGMFIGEEKWTNVVLSTDTYTVSNTITFPYVEGLLSIEARAFDSNGLPSIEQYSDSRNRGRDKVVLTIFVVKDNVPVPNCLVSIDGRYHTADMYGTLDLSVEKNTKYTVCAHSDVEKCIPVFVKDSDLAVTINLGLPANFLISLIIILVVGVCLFLVVFLVPLDIIYKILILVIGIVFLAFVFLFMNGYLVFIS